MANNRLLYSSQALFAVPGISGAALTTPHQLHRVLSINHGDAVTRQDVNQFGQRASIDRVIVEAPTVSMDISYLVTNAYNESVLGLYVNPTGTAAGSELSALTHLIDYSRDEQNYFIKVVPDGQDANLYSGVGGVIAVGNGSLGSYSVEARVGGFPTASARLAGLNIEYTLNSGVISNPALNTLNGAPLSSETITIPNASQGLVDQISAVRPGDLAFDLPSVFGLDSYALQSFSITLDMNRESLRELGTSFRYANELNFPMNASVSMEVLVRDLASARLANYLCADDEVNLDFKLRSPLCTSGQPATATDAQNVMVYSLRGAKYDGTTFNNGIGNGETATITYTVSIGGPNDLVHGLYLFGVDGI